MNATNPNPSHRRARAVPAAGLALALSVSLLLAACGDDDDGEVATGDSVPGDSVPGDSVPGDSVPGDTTPPGDDGTPITHPTGADEVVVQVLVGGGFVPVEYALTTIPSFTLLGDGTVVTPAPTTLQYPGPAIAPLQATTLDEAEVDALVALADELGLLDGPLDYGVGNIADAPTTTVTFVVDGRTVTHDAYAMGMSPMDGTTDEQQANREALQQFLDATAVAGTGDRPFEPTAIAVVTLPAPPQSEEGVEQPAAPWPLATPPGAPTDTGGVGSWPCLLVGGDDVPTLVAALDSANSATPWTVGDAEVGLVFRPVLPGQPGCPT